MEWTMTKIKEELYKFSAVLMVAGMPTVDGNIYPMHVLAKLVERFTLQPRIVIQEMNPVERKMKNIPLSEPWDKKIMAYVVSATIAKSALIINCECKNSREGKVLAGLIQSNGINSVDFFPVGYGLVGADGVISPDYRLSYVAFEPKRK